MKKNALYEYIKSNKANLSNNEQLIREYLLENYNEPFTAKNIAKKLYVSPSCMSRYLKKIKYKNLKQLNSDKNLSNESYDKIFANIVKRKQDLLEETLKLNDTELILEFANKISQNKTLYVYGCGYSVLEGKNIQMRLSRLGMKAILLNNRHDMILETPSLIKDSLFLFISQTGETEEIKSLANYLADYDVYKIIVTNNDKSTLAKSSDLVLKVPKIYSGYLIETVFSEITTDLLFDFIYYSVLSLDYANRLDQYNKTKKFLKLK